MGISDGIGLRLLKYDRLIISISFLLLLSGARLAVGEEAPAETNVAPAITAAATNEVPTNATRNAVAEPSEPAPTNHGAGTNVPPQAAAAQSNQVANVKAPKDQPPGTDTNWLSLFRVAPGFRLELVAQEPLVSAPVAMAFDENGRLFVAEMRDYPDQRNATPHLGRIRVLDDMDEHGVFNSSTVYADDLPWPSAVACYNGGIFVGATPQILYIKASNSPGQPEIRRVVFDGFGGTNASNADHVINNFKWGLDDRIHGASGGIGGLISSSNSAANSSVSIASSDFSFDPRRPTLAAETGPAESGLTFDSRGRKFLSDYARPLVRPMYEARYIARNPYFPVAPELEDVTPPALAIFQMTQGDLAQVRRVGRLAAAPSRGTNLFTAGWMTHARGIVAYRGAAFPTNYVDNIFIADPEAHVIHRAVLRDAGLQVFAERPRSEHGNEFIMSADPSFRPSQIINGPGGVLYVSDLRDGADSGRIYRIVPVGYEASKRVQLGKASARQLAEALSSRNGWESDTAARLLFERREPASVALVRDVLDHARMAAARLRALYTLDGIGALTETDLIKALQDPDATVRQHAVELSEKLANKGIISERLWAYLRARAADDSASVRYQLVFTLGDMLMPGRPLVLADILKKDWKSPWMQTAGMSSMAEGAGLVFASLAGDLEFRIATAGLPFLRQIATMTGTQGRQDAVGQVLEWINRSALLPTISFSLLSGMGDGLHRTGSSLALVDPRRGLKRFYDQALNVALDTSVAETARIEALRLLSVSPFGWSEVSDLLLALLGSGQTYGIQSATLATIGRYSDPAISTNLIARWPVLAPALRTEAVSALMSRTERLGEVIAALENHLIPLTDLSYAEVNVLRNLPDPALRGRALKLLGPQNPRTPAVLDQRRPALRLDGVAARGRGVFVARCAACHQLGGTGSRVGPDLARAKVYGKESILTAILEPSVQIQPGFQNYLVQTRTGDTFIGTVRDLGASIMMRHPGGATAVWPRAAVQALFPQPWSLMPGGLERGLSNQDLANLTAFILAAPR